jgi:hypothetical protein
LFIIVNADDFLIPNWIDYAIKSFYEFNIHLLGGGSIHFNALKQTDLYFSEMLKSMAYVPQNKPIIFGPSDAIGFTHDNDINMTMTGCSFLRSAWAFVGGFYAIENRTSSLSNLNLRVEMF